MEDTSTLVLTQLFYGGENVKVSDKRTFNYPWGKEGKGKAGNGCSNCNRHVTMKIRKSLWNY